MFSEPYQIPAHLRAVLAPEPSPEPSPEPAQTGGRLAADVVMYATSGMAANLATAGALRRWAWRLRPHHRPARRHHRAPARLAHGLHGGAS